jgi:hypothetical protein
MCYKILDISFDLVESYSLEVANSIDYFGCFCSEQVLIEENVDIYRYKERIKFVFVSVVKV